MALFYQNPDGKSNSVNRTTLPSRNYCIITEHAGLVGSGSSDRKRASEEASNLGGEARGGEGKTENEKRDGRDEHEEGDMVVAHNQTGGVDHPSAAAPQSGTTRKYALDISIRAEIDPKSPEGKTTAYGFSIPFLET